MTTALRIVAVRYQCPHCSRTRAKRAATEAHISRCWHNPEVRSCKTCDHYEPASDACGCETGCNWGGAPVPPGCAAGCDLPDGGPVSHCPLWQPSTD